MPALMTMMNAAPTKPARMVKARASLKLSMPTLPTLKKKAPPPPPPPAVGPKEIGTALAVTGAGLAASTALINAHVIDAPIAAYLNTVGVPIISAANLPELAIKWLHGANMGIVLTAMGGYGTYLGWQIRAGNGDNETLTGDLVRELHPKLMGAMALFFFLGGQGGLVFMLIQDKPLLESPHAITAFAGLGLLAANGVLGKTMKSDETKRTLHALLGSSLMAVFGVHAALGLNLGLSL